MNFYLSKGRLISFTFSSLKATPVPHLHKPTLSFSSSQPHTPKTHHPIYDYLTRKHGFSPETALKASTTTILSSAWKPENSDSVFSFLKQSSFSQTHIESLIKRFPKILLLSPHKIINPKIKVFQDLGFAPNEVADIITIDPWSLGRSIDKHISPSLNLLTRIVSSKSDIGKIIKRSSRFLRGDLKNTLIPNIEYFKSCGVSSSRLTRLLINIPRIFTLKPEYIKASVERLDKLGFDRKSNMFVYAVWTLSSMSRECWEHKLQLLRSLGFTDADIFAMFKRQPLAFTLSAKKIKEGAEYLLSIGNQDMSFLIRNPGLLTCSIERRLKPRMEILKILEGKNLVSRCLGLRAMCTISNKEFFQKYIAPNADVVGDLYKDAQSK